MCESDYGASCESVKRFVAGLRKSDPRRLQRPNRQVHFEFLNAHPLTAKRTRSRSIEHFEEAEIRLMLGTIDQTAPNGRRDYALLLTLLNTGRG